MRRCPASPFSLSLERLRDMSDIRDIHPMSEFRVRAIKMGLLFSWIVAVVLIIEGLRLDVLSEPAARNVTVAVAAMLAAFNLIKWDAVIGSLAGRVLLLLWGATMLTALGAVLSVEVFAEASLGLYLALVVFVAVIGRTRTLLAVTLISIASYLSIPLLVGHARTVASLLVPITAIGGVAVITRATTIVLASTSGTVVSQRDEIARKEANFERLYEVSRTISAGDSLENVLPELVGRIGTYLDCEVGLILLRDSQGSSLNVVSPIWAGGHALQVAGYRIGVQTHDPLAETFLTQQARIITSIDDNADDQGILGELGLSNAMAAILKVGKVPLGLMVLGDKRGGNWTSADLDDLVSLAAPAALVLAQLDRYVEVASAGKKMEDLARMKSEFVSVVSHELRTPLTSIVGALATLARPELAPERDAARELLASARAQTDRLRRLIEDLLIVSRIENRALPQYPVRVELADFVAEIIGEIPGAGDFVSVHLHEQVEIIDADPDHLHRILINLVQNAIKYAPGTPVEIVVNPRSGGQVSIAITDHGPGISQLQRDVVFDRFTQLEPSATRSQGGTGLGLHIVRGLIDAMGGQIEILDTPGGGATFNVILPMAPGSFGVHGIQV